MTTYKLISFICSIILFVVGFSFTVYCLREWIYGDSLLHGMFGAMLGIVLVVASIAIYQSLWEF